MWDPPAHAGWVRGVLHKETVAPAGYVVSGQSCPALSPPVLALKWVHVLGLHRLLLFSELLPLHWSLEQVILWQGESARSHVEKSWSLAYLCLSQMQSLLNEPDVMGTSFPALMLQAGELREEWDPLYLRGGLLLWRYSSQFLIATSWVWDLPGPLLHPSHQSQWGCFLISLVTGLLFS